MNDAVIERTTRAVVFSWVSLALIAAFALGHAGAATAQKALAPEVDAFAAELAGRNGLELDAVRRTLSQAHLRPGILKAMSAPATARPWHEFRSRNVDATRIAGGVRFWREHAAALQLAEARFGVPPELIVATIGIETMYGRIMGSFRVLDALYTLGFHHPTRGEFFRGELEQFLLLAREASLDVLTLRGSFAGAIGIPQFLPSSYRKFAIDFSGDGRRDLAGSAADAIGSVANYYRSFGWQTGGAIVVPVEADASGLDTMIAAGIKPHTRVGDFRGRGIVLLAPADDAAEAALFSVETETGTRYFLGLNNFYVITRYNRSVNYAMAVRELAAEIRTAMKLDTVDGKD